MDNAKAASTGGASPSSHVMSRPIWLREQVVESISVATLSGLPPFGDQILRDLGLALQPEEARFLVHAGHRLAAACRLRMTAMTWRLAAAFCASAPGPRGGGGVGGM
jgi:hypothetical protein